MESTSPPPRAPFVSVAQAGVRQHGGQRRAAQLSAWAEQQGLEVIEAPTLGRRQWAALAARHPSHLALTLAHALRLLLRFGPATFTLRGWLDFVLQGVWLLTQLPRDPDLSLHVEFNAGRNFLLALFATRLGRRLIAYPQNVEFLVPGGRVAGIRSRARAFALERALYRRAERVVAISDFDAAVVRGLGQTHVEVVAYEPVGEARERLERIAQRRRERAERGERGEVARHSGYLILGTPANPPTRAGMQALLEQISQRPTPHHFTVVGYGTDMFASYASEHVNVLGSVADEALDERLATCAGLVIQHPQTSGMLTRLADAEVAGIPVWVIGDYAQADDASLTCTTRISHIGQLP